MNSEVAQQVTMPMRTTQPNDLLQSRQYRLVELQVFNWGTFSGLHRIPVAKKGFLFVGNSGSGKSTLLDAMSTLLVPPQWLHFNTAAQEGRRASRTDRNLALYVRGAWAEQTETDSGEVAKQFLRTGTTWSAVMLRYENGRNDIVSLIGIFMLRGTHARTPNVGRHYIVAKRRFDLEKELGEFDLDIRKLKKKLPDDYHTDKFPAYNERFRSLLNINSALALKLLHKAQSAKNLNDLNLFLRDYMLDEPDTFAAAQHMVTEFAELEEAHRTVVVAREQVELLQPAFTAHQAWQTKKAERSELDELKQGLAPFADQKKFELYEEAIVVEQQHLELYQAESSQLDEQLTALESTLRELEARHRVAGGERLQKIDIELTQLEKQKQMRLEKRSVVEAVCKQLDYALPSSLHAHAELLANLKSEVEQLQKHSEVYETKRDELRDQLRKIEQEFKIVNREVKVLQQQATNIPAHMLELRTVIAQALRLDEPELPFVGELIEVRPDELAWQGAIERLLYGFALSLLVKEIHYAVLSRYVNENNLRGRLVYYRTGTVRRSEGETLLAADSLARKCRIKQGEYSEWLRNEMIARFDYHCVANIKAFRETSYALTQEGQIRSGNTRHEKDDRRSIVDKRYWVLGFDNQEKRKLYEARAQQLAKEIADLISEIATLKEKQERAFKRGMLGKEVINIKWQEIDVSILLNSVSQLQKEREALRTSNDKLNVLDLQITKQRNQLASKRQALIKKEAQVTASATRLHDFKKELTKLRNSVIEISLTIMQQEKLAVYFSEYAELTLKNLDSAHRKISDQLTKQRQQIESALAEYQRKIEKSFQRFKGLWPQEAADLDSSIEAAEEFFAKLTRLEIDGLPAYEERFFTMLHNQSMENLAALNAYMSEARKEIRARMEFINESLSKVPYSKNTFIEILIKDKHLEAVKLFRKRVAAVLEGAWITDRSQNELRFTELAALVEDLRADDADKKRWRSLVLDVRQHVDFSAREYDRHRVEVETFRGSGGKSGGQMEKLTATCLAAALAYQLSDYDSSYPLFAPVVLDEAFSKADNTFTQEAMRVFVNFGFQMIIATPFKSVMTLESFIGGVCVVSIEDRKRSRVFLLKYNGTESLLNLNKE